MLFFCKFYRASFVCATQNPLSVFCLLCKHDGDFSHHTLVAAHHLNMLFCLLYKIILFAKNLHKKDYPLTLWNKKGRCLHFISKTSSSLLFASPYHFFFRRHLQHSFPALSCSLCQLYMETIQYRDTLPCLPQFQQQIAHSPVDHFIILFFPDSALRKYSPFL